MLILCDVGEMFMKIENNFMKVAVDEAKKALKIGEIPVGCAVFQNGVLISSAHNYRESKNNSILHAEIIAISDACEKLGSWRLNDCVMYVTLEPCMMCMGAIVESRIKKVYFGTYNNSEQMYNKNKISKLVDCNLLENNECANLLSDFFKNKRKK